MALRPQSLAFTFLIGALAALPPLSIDLGLPALTLLQSGLGATPAQAALTLSLFLAGFGVAQLAMGPLSDRYGRRPVMLAGMTLYALAGLGCALAPNIDALLGFRLLEGIGAAGGTTLAKAVVRDRFDGQAGRIKMSQVSMVITIAPIIAPTLGGLLLLFGEWRLIYAVLALAGTMGVSTQIFGLLFAITSSGILVGSMINNVLARRGVPAWMPLGIGLSLAPLAALGAVLFLLAGIERLETFIPFVVLVGVARGLSTPSITHAALEPVPQHAGVTSALMGCGQMLCMALSGLIVALLYPSWGALGLAVPMLGFLVVGLVSWLIVEHGERVRRMGETTAG